MFWLRNKKNNFQKRTLICRTALETFFSPKNSFYPFIIYSPREYPFADKHHEVLLPCVSSRLYTELDFSIVKEILINFI